MLKEDIMNHIEFIRKQAKNFLKDWQTQIKTVESDGYISYHYDWKFYDVGDLFFYFELDDKDEQNCSLGHAQHYIAQMVGFKKWDDLANASEKELELAEFLLRHFKDAQDLQQWEEVTGAPHITPDNAEELLDYAQYFYGLQEKQSIAYLPVDEVTVLSGKQKANEMKQFDARHAPNWSIRKDSYIFCTRCNKAYNFNQSKVIKSNTKNITMVVCKNYPDCRGTYLDYKVLSPTIMYKESRQAALEKGIHSFKTHFTMDTKVHCIHCGKEYLYKEANAVKFPDDDEPLVYCKHYPECDGSLIDMMEV